MSREPFAGVRDEAALREWEEIVAVRDRELGPDHPDTLYARYELGLTYFHVGIGDARVRDAIDALERVAEDQVRVLGAAHPDTLRTWTSLTLLYSQALRHEELPALRARIVAGWEQVVSELEQRLGPDDPETQSSRVQLSWAYRDVGRKAEGQALLEQVVASWGRLAAERTQRLGPVHPDTVEARERHAYSHRGIDRDDDEVALIEQIATDLERLLGPADPRTLRAQVGLVTRYYEGAHDVPAAIALAERIIDDVRDVLGDGPDGLRLLRSALMVAYWTTGRTEEAKALVARYPLPDDSSPE
jgi:hypothetical protein